MEQDYNQEVEIDLTALFKLLLRKWWQIAICVVVGVAVVGAYAYIMKDDVYTAKSSMIVQVDSDTQNESTNLSTGTKLVDTYAVIVTSNNALTQLRENLGITYSDATLKNMITVSSESNTLVVNLEVESTSATEAQEIANELIIIVKDLAASYDGLEDVEILDTAFTPTNPSGPNRPLYLVIGVLLGGVVGVGLVLLVELLDRNIKTATDVENKLGVRLLGVIPEYELPEGDVE